MESVLLSSMTWHLYRVPSKPKQVYGWFVINT